MDPQGNSRRERDRSGTTQASGNDHEMRTLRSRIKVGGIYGGNTTPPDRGHKDR